jgi:lipopolysaccharide transport system ATP-binding protein
MTTVISVEHLSKAYRLGQIGTGTLTYDMKLWWAKARGKPNPLLRIGETDHGNRDGETIWALKDVSFKVEKGEVLGIIGRNGAGKSTLLKILSRVTAPTLGRITGKGRIASLLEVGTGFHPELTGRENIYLNGAILGMSRREIDRKFDEIVDFSEVDKFIDTPVKRYSSGMYVRLAFAVAAHLEPEILVVDEVLAVGDAEFQRKCLGKMGDVAKEGRTVLFVSHNMAAVNALCPSSLCLQDGKIRWFDRSVVVIENYLSNTPDSNTGSLIDRVDRTGSGEVRVTELSVLSSDGRKVEQVFSGQDISFQISYDIPSNKAMKNIVCMIVVKTPMGQPIFSTNTRLYDEYLPELKPNGRIICDIPRIPLNEGNYYLDVMIKQGQDSRTILDGIEQAMELNVVAGDYFGTGRIANRTNSPILVSHLWRVCP